MKLTLCFFILAYLPVLSVSQSVDLFGKLASNKGLSTENIHVINKTAQQFTITNTYGEFNIPVKLNDTLSFSSVQYKPKEVIISDEILNSKKLFIILEAQINVLDEVLVGKVLTGDLLFDVQNTEGKAPINFYDVGIPGYTGKLATQNERRLKAANGDGVSAKVLIPQILSGNVPIDPIINAISGRTKELKHRVEIEEKMALIRGIRSRLGNDFFTSYPLENDLKLDYFYFCLDDENFLNRCQNKTDFEILIYMKQKYDQYLENRKENKN